MSRSVIGASLVDSDGRLLSHLQPAVYLDTDVVADLVISHIFGFEFEEEERTAGLSREAHALRAIIKSSAEKRLELLAQVRAIVKRISVGVHLFSSPLAELEFAEINARGVLRELLVEAFGADFVAQRDNRKTLGQYLGEVFKASPLRDKIDANEEYRSFVRRMLKESTASDESTDTQLEKSTEQFLLDHPELQRGRTAGRFQYIFEGHFPDGFVHPGFPDNEVFLIAPIVGFRFTVPGLYSCLPLMAAMQVGAADILHVLFAAHLGCKYFASFDSDFQRVREFLADDFDLELINSPAELHALVSRSSAV